MFKIRSAFIAFSLWMTGLQAVGAEVAHQPQEIQSPPNIVLIYIDDLGWTDLGCQSSDYYETPHIDALAAQGMRFTDAYANAPNCAPSRACLMTGQYAPRHGIYTVNSSARGKSENRRLIPVQNTTTLDPEAITIAEELKAAGYATGFFGKWHLGDDPLAGPRAQGFDVNVGGTHAGHPSSYFSPYRNPTIPDGPDGEYLTDRLTDEALAFIDDHADGPFFVMLSHYAVHTPLQAPEDLVEKYRAKPKGKHHRNPKFAAMIERMDDSVGRVLAALDERGIAENTVVIFTSDNGGPVGSTSNAPLRGYKGMLYEGGIRVPLIVRWPGNVEPGTTNETPVIGTDLYMTFLDIAGISGTDQRLSKTLDGKSFLLPLTRNYSYDRGPIFWHFPAYLEAGSQIAGHWRTAPASAMRSGNVKIIHFYETGNTEMYNLVTDPGEEDEVIIAHNTLKSILWRTLKQWQQQIGAPIPNKLNPEFIGQ